MTDEKTGEFWVRSNHPVDVSPDGRVIAPGEKTGQIPENDPHNKLLIESGVLVAVAEEPEDRPRRRGQRTSGGSGEDNNGNEGEE